MENKIEISKQQFGRLIEAGVTCDYFLREIAVPFLKKAVEATEAGDSEEALWRIQYLLKDLEGRMDKGRIFQE